MPNLISTARNIGAAAIRGSNSLIMLKKLLQRLEPNRQHQAFVWAKQHSVQFEDFAETLDGDVLVESKDFSEWLDSVGYDKIKHLEFDFSGKAFIPLIYFLTRVSKPDVIVETGVAAGYSSAAFLYAIKRNGKGFLYSSDFPYFRIRNPELYIGYIVDDELKSNWLLDIRGDKFALPEIIRNTDKIDIFHYDSDKSYSGRKFAWTKIRGSLSRGAWVIFDDITDNLFFRDLVERENLEFHVINFRRKFVGLFQWSGEV